MSSRTIIHYVYLLPALMFSLCFQSIAIAQFRDSSLVRPAPKQLSVEDELFPVRDSLPHFKEIGLQALTGEIVFNSLFFGLGGDRLLKGQSTVAFGLALTPLAVPLSLELLHSVLSLKKGVWGLAALAELAGLFLGVSLLPTNPYSISYLDRYCRVTIPGVLLGILVYDLTIHE